MERENIVILRSKDEYDMICGVFVLKGNILDMKLLQNRIDKIKGELGYGYNENDIIKEVLTRFDEYKDIRYIPYYDYDLEV